MFSILPTLKARHAPASVRTALNVAQVVQFSPFGAASIMSKPLKAHQGIGLWASDFFSNPSEGPLKEK